MTDILPPNEPILHTNGLSVLDFWVWAYSDILSNRNRGIFAEFLVGSALDVLQSPRIEWDAYDLIYKGKRIEVKSSAFLQNWEQKQPSTISFDIKPKQVNEETIDKFQINRSADIYVFCLFTEQNPDHANVLDTLQWEFYVLPIHVLNEKLGTQKSISLKPLRRLCESIPYSEIKNSIDQLLQ